MAQEQPATGQGAPNHKADNSSDRARTLGAAQNKPRVLAPVEDSRDTAANPPVRSKSGSEPLVLPASNEVDKVGSSKSSAEALAEPLRASRLALDDLLTRTHAIHEQIWRTVESLLSDLHAKLHRECEARLADFEKEVAERGRYQTATLLDQIDLEAESRLAARVDRAMERAQESEGRGIQVLDEKVEASRATIVGIAGAATDELQRLKAASLEDLRADADRRLNALKVQHENDFQALAQKTAEALNDRLLKQSENRFQIFQERLKQLTDETGGQLETKLKALTDSALARASDDIQAMISRETSTYLIEALHKRLDRIASSLKE
jgi:hypothetical protein